MAVGHVLDGHAPLVRKYGSMQLASALEQCRSCPAGTVYHIQWREP